MAINCQNWGLLPRAGGWHDQDQDELSLMNIAMRAYRVGLTEKKHPNQLTPDDYTFIDWIFDDGTTTIYFS